MCIAVPVPVTDIGPGPMPMGHVSHNGRSLPCCFAYVPDTQVGDYVLVQNGFAIELLDAESVAASLAAFAELETAAPA
jgi:hydrogenase expression/formation protein HypC